MSDNLNNRTVGPPSYAIGAGEDRDANGRVYHYVVWQREIGRTGRYEELQRWRFYLDECGGLAGVHEAVSQKVGELMSTWD